MKMQWKTGHLQTRKRALMRHQICWHPDLRLLGSRTVWKEYLLLRLLSQWHCESSLRHYSKYSSGNHTKAMMGWTVPQSNCPGSKVEGKFILIVGLQENFLEKVIKEGDHDFKIPRKVYIKERKYRLRRMKRQAVFHVPYPWERVKGDVRVGG